MNITLSENFKKRFDELFLFNIFPVSKYLKEIINNGWRHNILTIREYNLIVLFYDFSLKMGIMQSKSELLINDFNRIEDAFLKLIINKININDLIGGLDKILKSYKNQIFNGNESVIEGLLNNLETFFDLNLLSSSFYNLILSFNIMKTKRFIQWEELIEQTSDEIVQTDFYDCPAEVFEQMVKYVKGILSDLKKFENEKKRIEWLRDLSVIKEGKPDKIIYYYEEILKNNWEKDSEDIILMLLALLKGINTNLESLIFKDLLLMNDKEEMIQHRLFNSIELEQFCRKIFDEYSSAKNKHISVSPPVITLKYFLQHNNPDTIFDANQKYIFEKINNIFYYLRQTAELFNNFLINDKSNFKLLMILKPVEWRKKIAENVIKFYMELFMQISSFFKEKNFMLELNKIVKIDDSIETCKLKLNSVLDKNGVIMDLINKE